ncbi:hypothetical protein NPIL_28721 [Nephila pilipes]|uniref:Uncharacterized protein n=1 Tax=Nephila pilipes TaxID=299642 RepID=A0A8X6TBU5_NEPPI|nr:hypothetical protein NPIL_28721 [Nephila pilipes]
MNRKLWKCCSKTFSDITKYTDHFLIVHIKNADKKGKDTTNRNDHTKLNESQDSWSNQIRIPENTAQRMNAKKNVTVVDLIGKSNHKNILRESVKSSMESNGK